MNFQRLNDIGYHSEPKQKEDTFKISSYKRAQNSEVDDPGGGCGVVRTLPWFSGGETLWFTGVEVQHETRLKNFC